MRCHLPCALSVLIFTSSVRAQLANAYEQCAGRESPDGPLIQRDCVSGTYCHYINELSSVCLPGWVSSTSTSVSTTNTVTKSPVVSVTTVVPSVTSSTPVSLTTSTPTPTPTGGTSITEQGLNHWALHQGRFFGTGVSLPYLTTTNARYQAIVHNKEQFGHLVARGPFNWDVIEPQRSQYNFAQADAFVNNAMSRGQIVWAHGLVWNDYALPAWVTQGGHSATALARILEEHVYQIVNRYRGRPIRWLLVNEPIGQNGDLTQSIWRNALGEDYIRIALQAARRADPSARLYFNQDIPVTGSTTFAHFRYIVSTYKTAGLLDGIGLMAHLQLNTFYEPDFRNLILNLAEVLRIDLVLSELNVLMPSPFTYEAQQATTYKSAIMACQQTQFCKGFLLYAPSDGDIWYWNRPTYYPPYPPSNNYGSGALWNTSLNKKPAYGAALSCFR